MVNLEDVQYFNKQDEIVNHHSKENR